MLQPSRQENKKYRDLNRARLVYLSKSKEASAAAVKDEPEEESEIRSEG